MVATVTCYACLNQANTAAFYILRCISTLFSYSLFLPGWETRAPKPGTATVCNCVSTAQQQSSTLCLTSASLPHSLLAASSQPGGKSGCPPSASMPSDWKATGNLIQKSAETYGKVQWFQWPFIAQAFPCNSTPKYVILFEKLRCILTWCSCFAIQILAVGTKRLS